MIQITLTLDKWGVVVSGRGSGHSGLGVDGSDPLCLAVSFLLRSCARTLESRRGVVLCGGAEAPGGLEFFVESYPRRYRAWMMGVGDVLITGLTDLCDEYPNECGLGVEVCNN